MTTQRFRKLCERTASETALRLPFRTTKIRGTDYYLVSVQRSLPTEITDKRLAAFDKALRAKMPEGSQLAVRFGD